MSKFVKINESHIRKSEIFSVGDIRLTTKNQYGEKSKDSFFFRVYFSSDYQDYTQMKFDTLKEAEEFKKTLLEELEED